MALGTPVTNKTMIGTFELRIGPLAKAAHLTQAYSVGIIDQVKLDFQMDSVDLMSGFPQRAADTAITRQVTGITATLRENSARNLNIMLGNGLPKEDTGKNSFPTDVRGTVTTTSGVAAGATSITVSIQGGGTISAKDILVLHSESHPEKVQYVRVSGVSGTTISLDSSLCLFEALDAGEKVAFYKAHIVAGGSNSTDPTHMTATLLRTDRSTGRPVGFHFWKVTISSGMSIGATVSDFGSYEMQLKALEPAASEYSDNTKPLYGVASQIANNPVFALFDVSDSATAKVTFS